MRACSSSQTESFVAVRSSVVRPGARHVAILAIVAGVSGGLDVGCGGSKAMTGTTVRTPETTVEVASTVATDDKAGTPVPTTGIADRDGRVAAALLDGPVATKPSAFEGEGDDLAPPAPPPSVAAPTTPGGAYSAGAATAPKSKAPPVAPMMRGSTHSDIGGVGTGESAAVAGPGKVATITTTTTITVPTETRPPCCKTPTHEVDQGGVLTAAIWDDNDHRAAFLGFVERYPAYRTTWDLDPTRRVVVRVTDSDGVLVGDAPIALRAPDGSVVNLRTHGDGTALYYPPATSQAYGAQSGYGAASQVGALRGEATFAVPQTDTTWTIRVPGVPSRSQAPALDLAFVVDCTGSMGDEIAYLQTELAGVVKSVKSEQSMRRVRLGLVLYRDRGDDYVTRDYDFTEDLGTFLRELSTAVAGGGGDMPESVNAALNDAVHKLSWAGDESARLAILVGDAPPHYYADEQYTYKNATFDLASRGVKLVTLGASGIDKSTEYVFREMSAITGGRYIFLTDDSGVGESHLTPDITGYQVEHLDRLLVRTIGDEVRSFRR